VNWHRVPVDIDGGPVTSLALGGSALIVGVTDGTWWAIEDRCSHAGCAFSEDGEIDGDVAICNCHGSEFDVRSGIALVPPAIDPIATFRVRVHDGAVEVLL
jgi:nitrite reductase/ring-hydroxylating ferredoxin subunit